MSRGEGFGQRVPSRASCQGVNGFGVSPVPHTVVLSARPPSCTLSSGRSHGCSGHRTPVPCFSACSELRGGWLPVGDGQRPGLDPQHPEVSQGAEPPALYPATFPPAVPGTGEICFHLGRTWPQPRHQCCSQEAGPFPRRGMWGSTLANKELCLGFQSGKDDSE